MTRVKICGLTEQQHLEVAVDAGADAIGFVFAPSRRRISVKKAKHLAAFIPENVLKIGVFVNATAKELHHIYEEVGLDFIQLHGEETPQFIREVDLPTIKSFAVQHVEDVLEAGRYDVDYYLFDAPGTIYRGGSGIPFDWTLLKNSGISNDKLILAGGLHVGNVKEAIERVQPFMVDVSSGVEKAKRKDELLIQTFIEAVQEEER